MKLDQEMLAQTLYRAHSWASQAGESDIQPWDFLALDKQAPYLRMARFGPTLLEDMEGEPFHKITQAFCLAAEPGQDSARFAAEWNALPRFLKLSAEAVVKHLAQLLDHVDGEDDDVDLPALERSWGEWVKGKIGPQAQEVTG